MILIKQNYDDSCTLILTLEINLFYTNNKITLIKLHQFFYLQFSNISSVCDTQSEMFGEIKKILQATVNFKAGSDKRKNRYSVAGGTQLHALS